VELLSSAPLLRCIYLQVAVLSEAKFGRERPPYFLSKHCKCNPGEVAEGEVFSEPECRHRSAALNQPLQKPKGLRKKLIAKDSK